MCESAPGDACGEWMLAQDGADAAETDEGE